MRLNTKAFALTCGTMWALAIVFVTAGLLLTGGGPTFMDTLGRFYFGYSVSWVGAIIGAVWGFLDGLIGGFVFAWLYNKISGA